MEKRYTLNLLIKYLYRETDIFETLEVEDALAHDYSLADEFKRLKKSFLKLPNVKFLPNKASMENILSYSRTREMNSAF